jgi:hypothetical protein
MTAPQLSRTSLAPVAAAWLAGGLQRAVDALLVSRLELRRIAVVDGNVVDRGLDRNDALDGAILDALGARGRRDLETVRWRVSRDRRVERLCADLVVEGLVADRAPWRRSDRPVRTGAGRRLLRELKGEPPTGAAWEVALHGRAGLTDRSLRDALEPPPRPPLPPQSRRGWLAPGRRREMTAESYAAGAAGVGYGGWGSFGGGADCGGFDGGGGGGGGDGGGC